MFLILFNESTVAKLGRQAYSISSIAHVVVTAITLLKRYSQNSALAFEMSLNIWYLIYDNTVVYKYQAML